MFSLCSLRYREQQGTSVQNIQQITNMEYHLILTKVTWEITATKTLVEVKGARRDREQVSSKFDR